LCYTISLIYPLAELPRSIRAFDAYTTANLDPFVAVCDKLGGDAQVMGQLVKEAWIEMRKFLLMASASKEPAPTALGSLLTGVAGKMKEISGKVNRNEWEKHSKTCSEGVQCLNWLCVKPAPRDFIESFVGASDYWANNIRREHRNNGNKDQIEFCDTFKALIVELMAYVKEYHTTGVTWNPKGGDAYNPNNPPANAAAPATAAAPAAAPAAEVKPAAAAAAPKAPTADLFAALNKDSAITSGLKKVTKDMQTWRAEYKADEAAPAPVPKALAPKAAALPPVKGPPVLEFEKATKKWRVENQISEVTVEANDIRETVYVLGCIGATIRVTGKCKTITLDNCKKTKLIFNNVISSVEVVNSQRIHVECVEKAPSVAIDKTDGIVVQLPLSSLDTTVVASKSSEMNIQWPDANGDLIERPIPEQYVHRINGNSITADVSDLYGH
jgi:adenylyl cyclase-associated protein